MRKTKGRVEKNSNTKMGVELHIYIYIFIFPYLTTTSFHEKRAQPLPLKNRQPQRETDRQTPFQVFFFLVLISFKYILEYYSIRYFVSIFVWYKIILFLISVKIYNYLQTLKIPKININICFTEKNRFFK